MRIFRNSAILLAICANLLAAQVVTTMTSRQTGNLVGASASSSGTLFSANVNISPTTSPKGGDAYLVSWSFISFMAPPPPAGPPPGLYSITASGLVPVSEIKSGFVPGALSVDLDISKLETKLFVGGTDCTSGPCISFVPVSFPLKGTFLPVAGIGSSSVTENGNYDSQSVDPYCTIMNSFNGNRSASAANFSGVIGSFAVVPPSAGANGILQTQKGQLRMTQICTPPPPPMP
jgi:hypothetical protein